MQQLASCPRLVSGARARPSARRTRAPALSRAEGAASLQELEAALSAAVAAEEWSEAARLRDELKLVRTNATAACLAASAAFYSAFERGSAAAMAAAWGTGEGVSCTHPGSACIHGRSSVLASWNEVFSSGSKFKVRLQDVVVHASETMGARGRDAERRLR